MEQGHKFPFIDKCSIINVSTLPIVALFVQTCSFCLYLIQSSIFLLFVAIVIKCEYMEKQTQKSDFPDGISTHNLTLCDLLSQRVVGSNTTWDFSKFVFSMYFHLISCSFSFNIMFL